MSPQQVARIMNTASHLRTLIEGKERLEGLLATLGDFVRRGGPNLRFFVAVLGQTGQLLLEDRYVVAQMEAAGRAALLDLIKDIERQMIELETPKECHVPTQHAGE